MSKRRELVTILMSFLLVLMVGCATTPNLSPLASFSCSVVSGIAPLSVTFDASGSSDPDGSIQEFAWSFGDGDMDSGVQVVHVYTSAGTYSARLEVTDNRGGTASYSSTITVTAGLSPPSWIQGTWSIAYGALAFTFSSDNIVYNAGGAFTTDYTEAYGDSGLSDTATSSSYVVTYTMSPSGTPQAITERFEKRTASTIDYSITMNGSTIGPISLEKL